MGNSGLKTPLSKKARDSAEKQWNVTKIRLKIQWYKFELKLSQFPRSKPSGLL